jgi:hypothetical protein
LSQVAAHGERGDSALQVDRRIVEREYQAECFRHGP